jgi:hypothetical protein
MKIIGFVAFILVAFSGKSQLSYDFAQPLPPEGKTVSAVSKPYFGNYSSDKVDIDYEFTAEGIFAVSIIYNSISRETIRESSQYRVKDGYLFGIAPEDSVPCYQQGEYYHFGLRFREQIIGGESKNVLTKLNETTYILNFEDNGHYTPSLIEFKGKELALRHFTYADSTELFDGITLKTEKPFNELTYVTLEPTLSEWKAIPRDEILGDRITFTR